MMVSCVNFFQLNILSNNHKIVLVIKGFNSESDLVIHYETFERNHTVMGVVFKDIVDNEVPKKLNYAIRPFNKHVDWDTETLFQQTFHYEQDSGKRELFLEFFSFNDNGNVGKAHTNQQNYLYVAIEPSVFSWQITCYESR